VIIPLDGANLENNVWRRLDVIMVENLNQVFTRIEYSRGKIALSQGYFSGS
jgi:hypothetical protein